MSPLARAVTLATISIGLTLVALLAFHLDQSYFSVDIEPYLPPAGAIFGALLCLWATLLPQRTRGSLLPWRTRERLAWSFAALGLLLWAAAGLGQLWLPVTGFSPFLLTIGSLALPLLLVITILLLPPAATGADRLLLALDSTVSLVAILGIAWNRGLFKALPSGRLLLDASVWPGLAVPLADLLLLGGAVLLLLRSASLAYAARPQRASLSSLVAGLLLYAGGDVLLRSSAFSAGSLPATWLDAVLAPGTMLIGLAAYLRRMVALTPTDERRQLEGEQQPRSTRSPVHLLPWLLLVLLCGFLAGSALSSGEGRLWIGLLIFALAFAVMIVRHLLTIQAYHSLRHTLFESYEAELGQLEMQLHAASRRSNALEAAIAHLKQVLTRLAGGDLSARANLSENDLVPLATSLNQIADRELRLELWNQQGQLLRAALDDLCDALERCPAGEPLVIPRSCEGLPQIERLLTITGLRQFAEARSQQPPQSTASPSSLSSALEALEQQSTFPMPAFHPADFSAPIEPSDDERLWL
jgi:hypothetical protein